MKECNLQKMVIEDIRKNVIGEKICCTQKDNSSNLFGFIINDILQRKYAEYTADIINVLESDITIVSDTKNINLANGRLYPDILTFGSDERFYLFELKVGEKTEREAVTELMAYRQEIRNHLPLLGRNEICFIIISEEYSTLLKHAVMSLLYENIPITCLKPYYDNEKKAIKKYKVVDIVDWTEIDTEITKQLFEGYSILWYSKKNKENINLAEFTSERLFAIDYLKNEAVKNGQNGFAYVWDRDNHDNALYATASDFGISVFAINSYALVYPVLVNYKDSLSEFILNKSREDVTGPVLEAETKKIRELMEDDYFLEMETFNNLKCYENMVFSEFVIKYCDAWGDLGEEFRAFYYKHRRNLFAEEKFNEPEVFMKLVNLFFSDYPFRNCDGKGEYFELGALFYIAINEGKTLDGCNYTDKNLYRLKIVWNLLFCSMYKVMPEYIVDKNNNLNLFTLKDILLRIKEAEKKFCSEIKDEKKKYAYAMGKEYAYYGEMVPASFKESGVVPLYLLLDEMLDELFDENTCFLKLQQYFYEEFLILADSIKLGKAISEKDWILFEGICIDNNIWYPNRKDLGNEEDINKRKKMIFKQLQKFCKSNDLGEIAKNKFSPDSVKYNLRKLLNANSGRFLAPV